MKNTPLLLLIFAALLFSQKAHSQGSITIHSITTDRMPSGDVGYTLDGLRMKGARAKLEEPANFGEGGTYKKSIFIVDDYALTGDLNNIMNISPIDLFYFGTFNKSSSSLNQFSDEELDALYEWSLKGGKMIIGGAAVAPTYIYEPDILNSKWGFDIALNLDLLTTDFYATDSGLISTIFDGPFGTINFAYQGGSIQGYLSTIPTDAVILASDLNGNPTLVLDCKTLDLILADGDGHNDLGGVTVDGPIVSENDIFWTNTIVYMDSLQGPPVITQNGNQLSTGIYNTYQWLLDGVAISGATSNSYTAAGSGVYTVEVSLSCGCNHVISQEQVIEVGVQAIPGFNLINFGPNPNKNGTIYFSGINESVTVAIYDVIGQLKDSFSLNKQINSYNLRSLPDGVYAVKIWNEKGIVIGAKKLIRQ